MKKRTKTILIFIVSLVLLGIIFEIVDHNRAIHAKLPIFAINLGKNKDTGAYLYYGLGYVAVRCLESDREYINFHLLGSKYINHVCFSGK